MEEFLEKYIQMIIENAEDNFEVTEEKKMDIVYDLMDNEEIWNILDEAILMALEPFKKEEVK